MFLEVNIQTMYYLGINELDQLTQSWSLLVMHPSRIFFYFRQVLQYNLEITLKRNIVKIFLKVKILGERILCKFTNFLRSVLTNDNDQGYRTIKKEIFFKLHKKKTNTFVVYEPSKCSIEAVAKTTSLLVPLICMYGLGTPCRWSTSISI